MKLRSSKKVYLENEVVNEDVNDIDENVEVNVYSLEADDSLIEDNKIWFVILIMALFIINYLYGCITNNSTSNSITSNSTDVIYW
jgi:hypothetical protein